MRKIQNQVHNYLWKSDNRVGFQVRDPVRSQIGQQILRQVEDQLSQDLARVIRELREH
jgi:hypothetical protein